MVLLFEKILSEIDLIQHHRPGFCLGACDHASSASVRHSLERPIWYVASRILFWSHWWSRPGASTMEHLPRTSYVMEGQRSSSVVSPPSVLRKTIDSATNNASTVPSSVTLAPRAVTSPTGC